MPRPKKPAFGGHGVLKGSPLKGGLVVITGADAGGAGRTRVAIMPLLLEEFYVGGRRTGFGVTTTTGRRLCSGLWFQGGGHFFGLIF